MNHFLYCNTVKKNSLAFKHVFYLSLFLAAGVEMNQIVGLGISTQRATFITWNK